MLASCTHLLESSRSVTVGRRYSPFFMPLWPVAHGRTADAVADQANHVVPLHDCIQSQCWALLLLLLAPGGGLPTTVVECSKILNRDRVVHALLPWRNGVLYCGACVRVCFVLLSLFVNASNHETCRSKTRNKQSTKALIKTRAGNNVPSPRVLSVLQQKETIEEASFPR
jgi:hypothetical protein